MAKDIVIAGATFNAVPSIEIPTAQGGTAKFVDASGSQTVTENGTYDVTVLAEMVVNVAGGGGGLEYEAGTFEPTADIARPTINFQNQHNEAPIFILMTDATGDYVATNNSNYFFAYMDWWRAFGQPYYSTETKALYGKVVHSSRITNATSLSSGTADFTYNSDYTGENNNTMPRYWAKPDSFRPYVNSSSRYWRAGRKYKWIAVWKPST